MAGFKADGLDEALIAEFCEPDTATLLPSDGTQPTVPGLRYIWRDQSVVTSDSYRGGPQTVSEYAEATIKASDAAAVTGDLITILGKTWHITDALRDRAGLLKLVLAT
jgi:hypothetical protein